MIFVMFLLHSLSNVLSNQTVLTTPISFSLIFPFRFSLTFSRKYSSTTTITTTTTPPLLHLLFLPPFISAPLLSSIGFTATNNLLALWEEKERDLAKSRESSSHLYNCGPIWKSKAFVIDLGEQSHHCWRWP